MTTYPGDASGRVSSTGDEGRGLGQKVDHLGADAQRLFTDARDAASELGQSLDLRGRVERNPYGMMAAALGVGYVLGGGLFTPLTARVLRLGMKLAALPFVKDELIGMAEAAVQGYQTGRGGQGQQAPARATPASGPSRPESA
ncbi:hypothetical protein [Citreicoccus inhibens]|uniref:hypothetical protein n=1 Tax=Citreicoccus inhibens TaxID=2849499 RepID=UPI001F360FE6|nr:hypothetical protein [Citreicoccus inhibens]